MGQNQVERILYISRFSDHLAEIASVYGIQESDFRASRIFSGGVEVAPIVWPCDAREVEVAGDNETRVLSFQNQGFRCSDCAGDGTVNRWKWLGRPVNTAY